MIREATEADLNRIAEVHIKCFPNSFSTSLGRSGHLLERLYSEYMADNPELFLVAEDDNKEIIGFCMGYYCEKNDYQIKFLKHNLFRICGRMFVLLVSFNSKAWKKIASFFTKPKCCIVDETVELTPLVKRGDLLSICVLPEYRGNGSAVELITKYHTILKEHNREICILTVENSNDRGIAFYKKNGYCPYKAIGNSETTFFCSLK